VNTADLRSDGIYVLGTGAQTPVGRSAPAAAAAVRCGISAYTEHSYLVDQHGEPMVVARAEWLDETPPITDRIFALAEDAAHEALGPLHATPTALRDVHTHLALSAESVPQSAIGHEILQRLASAVGVLHADSRTEFIAAGHAGGLLALENAVRKLRGGEAQLCLVGGADSWLDPDRLQTLDLQGRLHSMHNSWGFIPGEGAGFCLLATGASAYRFGLTPLAELMAVATGHETKLMGTQTVCIGEGLTAAFRGVLDPATPVAHSYCDFNGETYRADEYGFTICRTSEFFEDAGSFTAGAECWGDVGSASALLGMALATSSWKGGYAKGPVALVWGSGASAPCRGAALLREHSAPGEGN
jgi:3-oxoacyl-[acyl-carrier-protein] synthase-1